MTIHHINSAWRRGPAVLLAVSLGLASCALPAPPTASQDGNGTSRADAPAGRPAVTARPLPRPSAAPANTTAMPPLRDPGARASSANTGVPAARPSTPVADPARSGPRYQRAAAALAGPAPKICIAPDVVEQSLPLLPSVDRDVFQQLLAEGAALGAERGQWRVDVRQVKVESTTRRMNAPGFGCMNPGLGDGLQLPGRSVEGNAFTDMDCVAEANGTPGGGGIKPAFMSAAERNARDAVTARVNRLKSLDSDLIRREQALALSLGQLLKRATSHWQQSPAPSWSLSDLAGMETLLNQLALQCTAQQGRTTPASDALTQQATSALPAIFDGVLPLQAAKVTATLATAGTGSALRGEMKSLFPTPVLDQRARMQPWLASALQKEQARVAVIDARIKREEEARSAERARIAWENSPVFLARKRHRENAAANTAPTSDEVRDLVIDYLIADRENKVADFDRLGNRLSVKVSLPLLGTMQAYLGEINLLSLSCKPKDRKQFCELEYTERKLVGDNSGYEPTGSINRKHAAEFSWSEMEGLQSPGLKTAIAQAHKEWHDRVNAAIRRRQEIDDAMDMCKGGLPANPTARDRRRCAGR